MDISHALESLVAGLKTLKYPNTGDVIFGGNGVFLSEKMNYQQYVDLPESAAFVFYTTLSNHAEHPNLEYGQIQLILYHQNLSGREGETAYRNILKIHKAVNNFMVAQIELNGAKIIGSARGTSKPSGVARNFPGNSILYSYKILVNTED